jgi:hypothetical protein
MSIRDFDSLLQFINLQSEKRIKISDSFFNKIIGIPEICDLETIDKIFKKIIKEIKGFDSRFIDFNKDTIYMMHEQFPWMYVYYRIIQIYQNKNYEIFSLGSSLEKINMCYVLL